jgi:hypothetical protein
MMTRISNYDTEMNRAMVAREEFIAGYCFSWPAIYKAQMPVTYDGQSLLKAKQAIEAMMRDDFAVFDAQQNSPWHPVATAPDSKCIDWSKVNGQELFAMGLEMERPLGMPRCPKPGCENHPAVAEAQANAHRTAEYVAWIAEQRAILKYEAVSATANANGAAVLAVSAAHAAAEREFTRLRKDPRKGLATVRPAMSEEEREAELKTVSRD